MVTFRDQYNSQFANNVTLDGTQFDKAERLWGKIDSETKSNPKIIKAIALEMLQDAAQSVTNEEEVLARIHKDLDYTEDELANDISFYAGINLWQSEGKIAEAKKKIIEAYRTKSEVLNLRSFYLTSLPKEIGKLTHLTELYLYNNRLQSIPVEIGNLTHLTELYLDNNQLQSIPVEIRNLTQLIELHLYNNQLKSIPAEIGNLTHLIRLDLGNNQLKSIPAEIGNLTHLIRLDLGNNQLKSIPAEIGNLTHLTRLHLSNNQLQSIPAEIGNLTHLTRLHLSNNQLQSIPAEIGNLTHLIELYLTENRLQSIPAEIGNMTQLIELYLYHNQLQSIPVEIGNLTHLTILHLYNNQLQSIPAEIGNLTQLIELHLDNNQLQSIPAEIGNLTHLIRLHLYNNQLQSIPAEIGNLTHLAVLPLSNNRLQSIPAEIENLAQLTELYLDNNQLQSIPAEIGNLTHLTELALHNNRLLSLPPTLGELRNLSQFLIANNPELRELPVSLGNCNLTDLDCEETAINDDQRDAVLELCQQNRANASTILLPQKLRLWKTFANSDINFDGIKEFENDEKAGLHEWLRRLELTTDFTGSQEKLTKVVCQILQTVQSDRNFRELFFIHVKANNVRCEDRAAMTLNEIYTSWKIHTLQEEASLKEKLNLLTGLSKTLALRSALAKLIGDEPESVEIYLYYEKSLRESLNLVTAIQSMAHAVIGHRSRIDEQQLIHDVNNSFFDELYSLPAFEKLYEQDKDLQLKLSEINEKYQAEFDNLGEISIWADFQKSAKTQEEEKRMDEALEHGSRQGEIMSRRDLERKTKIREWYKNKLLSY